MKLATDFAALALMMRIFILMYLGVFISCLMHLQRRGIVWTGRCRANTSVFGKTLDWVSLRLLYAVKGVRAHKPLKDFRSKGDERPTPDCRALTPRKCTEYLPPRRRPGLADSEPSKRRPLSIRDSNSAVRAVLATPQRVSSERERLFRSGL